jgi:hypothetical protein
VILEHALLRQQVIVLKRQIARPQLTTKDCHLLVVVASRVQDLEECLIDREAGDAPALAPTGFQALLATEIEGPSAQAADRWRDDYADQTDGRRQSALGDETHPRWIVEVGHSGK